MARQDLQDDERASREALTRFVFGPFSKHVEERETGLEPATSSLGSWHSTTELLPRVFFGFLTVFWPILPQNCEIVQRLCNGFCMLVEVLHVANILCERLSCKHRFPKPLVGEDFTAPSCGGESARRHSAEMSSPPDDCILI